MRRQALLVILLILLLRVPFLNIAAQWDDFNYLKAAEYSLQHPLHPSHVRYVFIGEWHDMKGHPHPPGAAWTLGILWRLVGAFREVPFHTAYLGFNLLAGLSALILARRFVPERALEAALLFCVTPAFAVSGTSFESDLPFLAFWLAAVACLVDAVEREDRRLLFACGLSAALAAAYAYQAVFLVPVLALWLFTKRSQSRLARSPAAWACLLAPLLVVFGYQLFERLTTGAFPISVLSSHMANKGWNGLGLKLKSGSALTAHLGFVLSFPLILAVARRLPWWQWLLALVAGCGAGFAVGDLSPLFVVPFAAGILLLLWLVASFFETPFLAGYCLMFFAAAVAIFFAGAQRYLLPMAAPLAILACLQLKDRPRWLWFGFVFQICVAIAAATVNADHWNQTRAIAQSIGVENGKRTFVSGEWGIRWYMEQAGALPLTVNQSLEPGDRLVESVLNGQIPYLTGGGELVTRGAYEIVPRLPLRLAGLETKSGYAAVSFGHRPFGFSTGPVDRITFKELVASEPVLSWLPMNAPSAATQIVAGVFGLEQNEWRWAGRRAAFLLKQPDAGGRLVAEIYVPGVSPARRFELRVDGMKLGDATVPGEGVHRIEFPAPKPAGNAKVEILADKDFTQGADQRALSFIVKAVGYQP